MQNVYNGAVPSRNDTTWPPSRAFKGANSTLNRWRLTLLRDRARQMAENNPLAVGMLDRAVENVIGHGMRLQAMTDDPGFNEQAEELWRDWIDKADIRGVFSGAEFQRVIYRHHLLDGDVGCGLVSRGTDCFLQGYEGDLIDTANGGYRPEDNVVDGIQFDSDNRAVGYYVTPFDQSGVQMGETFIRARDFIFYPRLRRLSQIRGEPCFSQVFKLFDQIDGYQEAVIVAARIAACQGLMIKSNSAANQLNGLKTATDLQGNPRRITQMEPGIIHYLQPGEEVQTINPSQPTQSFPDFMAAMLRFAGLTLGLPLELVLLDFSRTNYSSARASLLQAYRSFRTQQQSFCERFMSRTYRWRISKWVKNGQLVVPPKLLGVPADGTSPAWWNHQWIAPGWAWVDPVKELQAALMAIDGGLATVSGTLQEHGKDLRDLTAVRAREIKLFDELGIVLSKSNMTRDAIITPAPGTPTKPEADDGSDPDEEIDPSDDPGTDPE